MNSIEERYGCATCKKEFCGDCEQGFKVLGAKEQKAIDDVELTKLKKELLLAATFAIKAKEQEMINKALSNFCDAACGRGICKIKCDSECDKRRYFESVMTGKPVDTGIITFDESVGTIFDI